MTKITRGGDGSSAIRVTRCAHVRCRNGHEMPSATGLDASPDQSFLGRRSAVIFRTCNRPPALRRIISASRAPSDTSVPSASDRFPLSLRDHRGPCPERPARPERVVTRRASIGTAIPSEAQGSSTVCDVCSGIAVSDSDRDFYARLRRATTPSASRPEAIKATEAGSGTVDMVRMFHACEPVFWPFVRSAPK